MISACIIAKNSEKYLKLCLDSIYNYVDEIIIADTGSVDSTISIAKSYNCKILQYNWDDNFSNARNYIKSFAKYPFILSIDSDEILKNGYKLRNIVNLNDFSTGAYLVNVVSENMKSDIFNSMQIRLFKNLPFINYEGRVHEQLIDSIIKNNFQLQKTNIEIYHLGYKIPKNELFKKYERNLKLIDLELYDRFTDYFFIHKANTLYALERFEESKNFIIDNFDLVSSEIEKSKAMNLLADIYLSNNDKVNAILYLEKSLNLNSKQFHSAFKLADLFYDLNNIPKALEYIELAEMCIDQDSNLSGYLVPDKNRLIFKKAKLLILSKQYAKALKYLCNNISFTYSNNDILFLYSNALFRNSQFLESIDILKKLKSRGFYEDKIDDFIKKIQHVKDKTEYQFINTPKLSQVFLTLCMIVKNEEENLEGCLESVKNLCDEIILVDTGSVDRTIEIAKRYNCKIYKYQWNNDFSSARNESLKYASGKWILYLDADERIIVNYPDKLRSLLEGLNDDFCSINCIIESKTRRPNGGIEIQKGMYQRIFRNYGYPTIQFEGRVHEQIAHSLNLLNKKTLDSDIVIYHKGYDLSEEMLKSKTLRNLDLIKLEIYENPNNSYAYFHLGQVYIRLGDFKSAMESLNTAVKIGNLGNSITASAFNSLSQLVGYFGNYKQSMEFANKSLSLSPNQEFARLLLAESYIKMNKELNALRILEEIVINRNSESKSIDAGIDIVFPLEQIELQVNKLKQKLNII